MPAPFAQGSLRREIRESPLRMVGESALLIYFQPQRSVARIHDTKCQFTMQSINSRRSQFTKNNGNFCRCFFNLPLEKHSFLRFFVCFTAFWYGGVIYLSWRMGVSRSARKVPWHNFSCTCCVLHFSIFQKILPKSQ